MPDNSIINEKTLKVNSLQSKSLNDFINSSFEIAEEEFLNLSKEQQDFILFIKEEEKLDEIIEKKKRLIPPALYQEVCHLVNKNYSNDWQLYFDDVIYFDVFTLEDFFYSRLDKDRIQRKEHNINKLSRQNLSLRRKLKNKYRKAVWHAQVLLKMVGGNKHDRPLYISNSLKREYQNNYKANQKFINDMCIIGENGDIIPLSKAVRTQEQKTAEHLNIVNAMEKRMELHNEENPTDKMDWLFITLTLKPELHPNPTSKNSKNSYEGMAPHLSAKTQKADWNKVRALLRKKGILPEDRYYGVIVSESHKDGCQHLHLIFFYFVNDYNTIRSCFFQVFPNLNDSQKDKKCSFKRNDGSAKASSYVFKYITKATSNFDPKTDIFNLQTEQEKGCLINSAFRSFNGIRGIQYFGIANCLTKWRFLSRNIKRLDINQRLEEIIINQDLYSFIAERHFENVENKYHTTAQKTKKFIGCIVDNLFYIKRFFSKTLFQTLKTNKTDLFYLLNSLIDLANSKKEEVLVSHNYSRGKEKDLFPPGFLLNEIDFN